MKVSIIIPAYNEEKRIGKTLEEYLKYFDKLVNEGKLDYEILVVINNTTDRTEEIVSRFAWKNKRLKYLNLKPGGKGFAVIGGFKDALKRDNDLIGFVDADMATYPEEYYKLIKNIGRCGGVIASRYLKGSVIKPLPSFQRLIAKWMFNTLTRAILFLPYRDTQCGAKIFKRQSVEKILPKLTMSQWAFDVELLYLFKKENLKINEAATEWYDKEYSKINFWKAGPRMALGVARLRLINSPFRIIIFLYDSFLRFYNRNGKKSHSQRESSNL